MQELQPKLALESKLQRLQAKTKSQQLTIRYQKQRINELTQSRHAWKVKYNAARQASPPSALKPAPSLRPTGYHYSLDTIRLSVWLYVLGGCSYRKVVAVLLYLQTEWGIALEVPAKSSVVGWVEKLGCYRYEHPPRPTAQPYALLVDECMIIGGQRLVVILGLPAHKADTQPTRFEQVWLLRLAVRASWTAQAIQTELEAVIQTMGRRPAYVVSDGAATLKKGIADAGLVRVGDVSHELALLLEHSYKSQPMFMGWQHELAQSKFKYIMTDSSYLLPPKQRSVARFMNLWASIEWSERMLRVLPGLSQEEQARFGWLRAYGALIGELGVSFGLTRCVRVHLQRHGISAVSVAHCRQLVAQSGCVESVKERLESYLEQQLAKVGVGACWHGCTSVLESLFGHYKSGLPTNPLAGVSGVVLSLSLRTDKGLDFELCQGLESVSLADVAMWKRKHLVQSQVVRRRKVIHK